ncbi:hypothetical protein [Sorangium cellulosum]|uniref:Uncharacterized protein n=1 Tax=Sorangium cellulosum So0157-2 TaxID=1254432 RepID=S4XR19_SORCE|nr:hypothetical protein [Sorangium cellulosum]AGP34851.1 hypothetical protein SCE1572_10195 [Sorangium cellulosum So0157-2]
MSPSLGSAAAGSWGAGAAGAASVSAGLATPLSTLSRSTPASIDASGPADTSLLPSGARRAKKSTAPTRPAAKAATSARSTPGTWILGERRFGSGGGIGGGVARTAHGDGCAPARPASGPGAGVDLPALPGSS